MSAQVNYLTIVPEEILQYGWILYPFVFFLLVVVLTTLTFYIGQWFSKYDPSAPWYEQAAASFPGRNTLKYFQFYLALFVLLTSRSVYLPVYPLPEIVFVTLCLFFTSLGFGPAYTLWSKRLNLPLSSLSQSLRLHAASTVMFVLSWYVTTVGIFELLGEQLHLVFKIMIFFFALAFLERSGIYWNILRILRMLQKPTPNLSGLVEEVAREMNLSFIPRCEIAMGLGLGAIARLGKKSVIIGNEMLEFLNDAEIKAILRHEYAHLTEDWYQQYSRYLPTILIFLSIVSVPYLASNKWPFTVVVLTPLSLIALSSSVASKISIKLEERADKLAITPNDKGEDIQFAYALEKLHKRALIPVTLNKNDSHPDLYDRMVKAGVTPDYPRPKEPRTAAESAITFGGLVTAGVLLMTLTALHRASASVFIPEIGCVFQQTEDRREMSVARKRLYQSRIKNQEVRLKSN